MAILSSTIIILNVIKPNYPIKDTQWIMDWKK